MPAAAQEELEEAVAMLTEAAAQGHKQAHGIIAIVKEDPRDAGAQNNLGNLGPDNGEKLIRYQGVGIADGQPVDLVIRAIGPYHSDRAAIRNGCKKGGSYGEIHVSVRAAPWRCVDAAHTARCGVRRRPSRRPPSLALRW